MGERCKKDFARGLTSLKPWSNQTIHATTKLYIQLQNIQNKLYIQLPNYSKQTINTTTKLFKTNLTYNYQTILNQTIHVATELF